MRRIISLKRTSIVNLRTNLDTLSPNNTLNRGYSIAYDKNRSIIRKPDDVDNNEPFTLKTAKGEMAAIKKSSTQQTAS